MSAAPKYTLPSAVEWSGFSIAELVGTYRNLRHLHLVVSTYSNQPRCDDNAAGYLFDDIADLVGTMVEDASNEIVARSPKTKAERHQRDFAIVDYAIFENDPIEVSLAAAFKRIGRKVVVS